MLMTRIWEFRAIDTLFFRDGTPHNAGEGGGVSIKSVFPPYMFTLQGAIRTGLAMGQGWTPTGEIAFPVELGDSRDLGEISFEGPYLKVEEDYLFLIPLNLLYSELNGFARVLPGEKLLETDMGKVRLPVLEKGIQGAKIMNDFLVKADVLEKILGNGDSTFREEDFIEKSSLWREEKRTGIAIEKSRGASEDSMLYFTSHIRPDPKLSIVVKVKGISEQWHQKAPLVLSLGGEGRMAVVQIKEDEDILPPMPELKVDETKIRFTVTLVTPGCIWPFTTMEDIRHGMNSLIKNGYPFIPGNCISACIGKVQQLGGFNIEKREPRPLIPIIPPGSMWFYEGHAKDIAVLEKLHGKVTNPMGFNQIIIGNWGEKL
jgi:CRISPR-associated protein Cmr3